MQGKNDDVSIYNSVSSCSRLSRGSEGRILVYNSRTNHYVNSFCSFFHELGLRSRCDLNMYRRGGIKEKAKKAREYVSILHLSVLIKRGVSFIEKHGVDSCLGIKFAHSHLMDMRPDALIELYVGV